MDASPDAASPAAPCSESERARWARVRGVTFALLGGWAAITFGTSWFARDLDQCWFGWPLNWWIAAQGALVAYVVVIGLAARALSPFDGDDDHGHHDDARTDGDDRHGADDVSAGTGGARSG